MGGDHVQIPHFSGTQYNIVLSCDLLVWITVKGRIPRSFTNFITSPDLSGHLYISPDAYHTQITEYLLGKFSQWALFSLCIEDLPNCYSIRVSPSSHLCIFREHLSRALPTKRIFDLLGSYRSEHLILVYSPNLKLDTLEVVIKWLQVSVCECNRQTWTLQTKIRFVSRDLIPSDRATCTIASRMNFFGTRKLSLKFDFEVRCLRITSNAANVTNAPK